MDLDKIRKVSDRAGSAIGSTANASARAAQEGYETAREYAGQGLVYASDLGDQVGVMVRRDPWMAVACAFAIGYVVARVINRMR